MLTKTIEYTDYNGTQRKEDFYFNLNESEITELEFGVEGGLAEMITNIINARDNKSIIDIFKKLILKAYGEKTADGKRFRKVNDAGVPLYIAFSETEAYNKLFMELGTDADAAAKFFNGIIPKPKSPVGPTVNN